MNFLEKYSYVPEMEKINASLEMLSAQLAGSTDESALKTCFSLMDLTSLKNEDTPQSIDKLVAAVRNFAAGYPQYPLPASLCVFPNFASLVSEGLKGTGVHTTVVSGCFPASQSYAEVKCMESRMAVEAGADEVDIVLALNSFLAGDSDAAGREIRMIRQSVDAAAGDRKICLKVILETGILCEPAKIAEASFLAMEAGADFIKTSTGKVAVNATPVAAYIMCECIREFFRKTGRKVGFKAAGGLSTAEDAMYYYLIVSSVLGKEWLDRKYFRFGVSRMANNLISSIEQKNIKIF